MSASCGHNTNFDGSDPAFKRALWVVVAINAIMFVVEIIAGEIAGSQALKADALDFFADAVTYAISLAVIGAALRTRALAAMAKGISLLLMGLWVFGTTLYQALSPVVPEAEVMGVISVMALIANLLSVLILMKWREGDANVRSVWLCSRNDAIGNVAVMLAALGVFGTGTAWPDLLVAGIMAGLFLSSSFQIIRQARRELKGEAQHGHDHHHDHGHKHGPDCGHHH